MSLYFAFRLQLAGWDCLIGTTCVILGELKSVKYESCIVVVWAQKTRLSGLPVRVRQVPPRRSRKQ